MIPRSLQVILMAAALLAAASAWAPAQGPSAAAALAALDLMWTDEERGEYRAPRREAHRPALYTYNRSNSNPDRVKLEAMVIKAANLYKIPSSILLALITHESQWQVNAVNYNRNRTHDMGLGQLNSETWEGHLKRYFPGKSPFDPWTNIQGSAFFLAQMHSLMPPGSSEAERWRLALMSYNMGPRRILEACRNKSRPPEIGRRYAERVLALSRRYQHNGRTV